MKRESGYGGSPFRRSYSEREGKKVIGTNIKAQVPTSDNLQTSASMSRFFPRIRPGGLPVGPGFVVREVTVNHVRGIRVTPVYKRGR